MLSVIFRVRGGRLLLPMLLALGSAGSAQAVDGCRVLLCLAGDWKRIPECRPDVTQAFRDLRRGKPWPTCAMAGNSGTAAEHRLAHAPSNCPPQYTETFSEETGLRYRCHVAGVVQVTINARPWASVWWDFSGDTATDYSEAARLQLGDAIDPRFEADRAAWRQTLDALPGPAANASE